LKRKAESVVENKDNEVSDDRSKKKRDTDSAADASRQTKKAKNDALVGFDSSGKIKRVHWLADKNSGAFYGSCIVEVSSSEVAKQVMDKASGSGGIKLDKKKIRVSYASVKEGEIWPPKDYVEREFPPVGG
jgi:hypothetical protein